MMEMVKPGAKRITRAAGVDRSGISGSIDQAGANQAREIGVADPPPDRTARFTET
jgi:hypothetical protein